MQTIILDSADFAPAQRLTQFRDMAAHMTSLDIHVKETEGFGGRLDMRLGPELHMSRTRWTPAHVERSARHAYDTGDNVLLHIPLSGQLRIQQTGGAQAVVRPGELYVDPTAVPGVVGYDSTSEFLFIGAPRALLEQKAEGLDIEGLTRRKPTLDGRGRLLVGYAGAFMRECGSLDEDTRALAIDQILQLMNRVLRGTASTGSTPDAEPDLKAARRWCVKQFIACHLTDPALSPARVAAACGLSERWMRALFAEEDTSFQKHVQDARLEWVWQRLADPPLLSLAELALAAGFGDVSWFNHCFRRRYGKTPSQARAEVLQAAASAVQDPAQCRPPRDTAVSPKTGHRRR